MILPPLDAALVDHPALPVPDPGSHFGAGVRGPSTPVAKTDRTTRQAIAVQLAAMTAALAEVDLWPTRSALRRARVVDRDDDGPCQD